MVIPGSGLARADGDLEHAAPLLGKWPGERGVPQFRVCSSTGKLTLAAGRAQTACAVGCK